jgi:hypothetical protein
MVLAHLSPYFIHIQMSDNFSRAIFYKWKSGRFPACFVGKQTYGQFYPEIFQTFTAI